MQELITIWRKNVYSFQGELYFRNKNIIQHFMVANIIILNPSVGFSFFQMMKC